MSGVSRGRAARGRAMARSLPSTASISPCEQGEHVTLLGPSGCGKTTTLRAIAGLETPTGGRIVVDGATVFDAAEGIDTPPEKRGLSMVFQSYAIWPHMTVFENVALRLPRARHRARDARARRGARAVAGRSRRLSPIVRRARLSGGQQQRVALARAIAYDTKIVLLDEPLSNLDAQLRIAMRDELARAAASPGLHRDLCDARPGGGVRPVGPHHRDARRPDRAAGHAGRNPRRAAHAVRRELPRHDEHPRCGDRARRGPGRSRRGSAPDIVLRARDPWQNGAVAAAAGVGFRPVDVRLGGGAAGRRASRA